MQVFKINTQMKKISILSSLFLFSALVFCSFAPTPSGYKAGDQAMDFTLKNVDGKMVSLSNYPNAKGFIVVFTCNHCPFAKMYESRIMALDQQYASKGYPVIAISGNDATIEPDDSYDNMVTLAKTKSYTFPYLYDESQQITTAYGATNTPHVFVLNKEQGGLIVKYIGAIDDNAREPEKATKFYVADAVNALLSGNPIAVTQTKAIGCGIKWRKS
jgi:peroxiredoxin